MIIRLPILFSVVLILTACASNTGTYTVKSGDSLSAIARRHNLTITEISRMNNITNPNRIHAGQVLKVRANAKVNQESYGTRVSTASSTKPSTNASSTKATPSYTNAPIPKQGGWSQPTRGKVVRSFNPNLPGHKGIQISGSPNQAIYSANDGEVVYSGRGNSGYGQLIIIKHTSALYSAYGYLSSINVSEGARVKSGQQIGTMGQSNDGRTVLYFEIRANGSPINPTRYISY